ncbi:hypothetical protein DBB42_02365 [Pseudomonas plecoglossicida]|uniref:Uncharacterized protein n=1 Tax=Pseudomonas plecoglossicida TaxID=70775 RepID=A0A2R7UNX4_PSEDL|nr:hypothetical protein DBB42_02365 [Pseudomonas plecoglossicida]
MNRNRPPSVLSTCCFRIAGLWRNRCWPYRRQASSHRYPTGAELCGFPVGAGLPAKRQAQE